MRVIYHELLYISKSMSLFRRLYTKYVLNKTIRVSEANPKSDLLCDDCKHITDTTENEVWTDKNIKGNIKRLCNSCKRFRYLSVDVLY